MSVKFPAAVLALGLSLAWPCGAAEPAAPEEEENLLPRAVFQTLLGEIALQRGETRIGVEAWADLAQLTRDPKVLARAVEVASLARQYDLALEVSRLWLRVEPDSMRARQAQTLLLAQTNRFDELAPQVVALLERDPGNIGGNLLHLNRILARHSDKKAVQRLIDQWAAPYANHPEAHFAMAQAAANAGDEARASAEMDKALQLRPDWESAALARAQLQARQSSASASAGLEDFVGRNPGAREARLALAQLLVADKRYADARQHFERLLKDNPDSPEIIYPIAMLALQQGDTETGRRQLDRLLATDYPDKSTVHFFLGQLDQEQNKPEAALAHFRQVTSGNQYVAARVRAALILQEQGQLAEARELLRGVHGGSSGERTQLILAEAQLLREAGRHGEAYEVLVAALGSQPDNPNLLYDAALTAERAGRPQLLESHLQHLLGLYPEHAHALNALGYSWAERNVRLAEAHEMIARAVALQPDDPYIADSLGWVLYRLGRLEEARAALERAYGIKADPEIAAHLGEVLWQLGRRDEAQKFLAEAARQFPGNEILAAVIKKLQP
ncbi:MAG: tetratricopeptide repeat protein [Betaproteobacteria bacterium]|nr:tetratricopeptide repeat protein [Betaproteobacteria bacterium]MCL2885764.1 tetratricopeptide repeat protein [Betaproteobacteria bacterium]